MQQIPLTQGEYAIVDDEDFIPLSRYKWWVRKTGSTSYAMRQTGSRGNIKNVHMHREIIKTPDGFITDHINGNGLDNRKINLRVVTVAQNGCNSKIRSGNSKTSKYKGVYWHKNTKKWQARIWREKHSIYIGLFDSEEEAAFHYDMRAKKYFGEFARMNFSLELH